MVELDPRYADVIIARWQNLTGEKATLAASGVSFDDAGGARRGAA